MPFGKATPSQLKGAYASDNDLDQDMPAGKNEGAANAKVTLVKPVPVIESMQDDSAAKTARPKIGRPTFGLQEEKASAPDEVAKSEEALAPKPIEISEEAVRSYEPATTRPWDFKFALFLVTLFIAVNLTLIILLHANHKSMHTVPAEETASVAKVAPETVPSERPAALMPSVPVPPAPAMEPPAPAAPEATPAPQAAAPAMVPVATPENPQELLSIIGKD